MANSASALPRAASVCNTRSLAQALGRPHPAQEAPRSARIEARTDPWDPETEPTPGEFVDPEAKERKRELLHEAERELDESVVHERAAELETAGHAHAIRLHEEIGGEERLRISAALHAVQEALNNYRAQIGTESNAVSAKYDSLVGETRRIAGTYMTKAWDTPPLTEASASAGQTVPQGERS